MSHGSTGIRTSQKKTFPVLSDSLCLRKKEMPHPSEVPDSRQVLNAKPSEPGSCQKDQQHWGPTSSSRCSRLSSWSSAALQGGSCLSPRHGRPSARHRENNAGNTALPVRQNAPRSKPVTDRCLLQLFLTLNICSVLEGIRTILRDLPMLFFKSLSRTQSGPRFPSAELTSDSCQLRHSTRPFPTALRGFLA